MYYVGNAFSLGMLDCLANGPVAVVATLISEECARLWVQSEDMEWESCVGHADTALLLASILGVPIEMRRVTTSLKVGDQMLVAQYNGPRLPEGATSLPEGAKIRWIIVEVQAR